MLSNLQVNPLTKALKWLTWLIGVALILLVVSIVSFEYIESDAASAQLEKLKMIENDTLSNEALKNLTSLKDLLATPEKYHNQYVRIKGYLNLEFEGDAIYWHKSDYYKHLRKNACWVEFSDSLSKTKQLQSYSQRYVVLGGIFDTTRQGHMSLYPGEIRNITSLNALQRSIR